MDMQSSPLTATGPLTRKFSIKVIGVGGAGGNAVEYMLTQDFAGVSFLAANTDVQALAGLSVPDRLTLGANLTRGLGTGGDPEMGRAAAEEDVEKIRELCAGADVVCVVAGLGGGTGTGAGPVIAGLARATGALVLGIVTLPFDFEGSRRQRQAQMGLRDLKLAADGVIAFPNQKVYSMVDQNTKVPEALRFTNELLSQGVRGIWQLLTQPGLINVDFNDLAAVLRNRHEESSLATVEASGENRTHEVLEKLAKHPFLEGGQVLSEADAVLVSLSSGPDLTMAEVNRIMEQINRQCENAHIIMGAGIQESATGRLSVTVVASRRRDERSGPPRPVGGSSVGRETSGPGLEEFESELANPGVTPRTPSRYVPPAPTLTSEQTQHLLNAQGGGGKRRGRNNAKQGQLQLEIVSRGRFEKSEPTVHQGEDLDVPTYVRRGVALN